MELLPTEFITFAKFAKVSEKTIQSIIGINLMNLKIIENADDMNWRAVPSTNDISLKNWEVLENYQKIIQLKNIARRQVFQTNKLFCSEDFNTISSVAVTEQNSIKFTEYYSKKDFIESLTNPFLSIQSVDQKLKLLEGLSSIEFFVIVALIELFLSKYSYPDSNWIPDELITFSSNSIQEIIKESEHKIEDQTWWQHWNAISNVEIPNTEAINTALLLLQTKALIGNTNDVEDNYFIGKSLLWLIRSIAWWDKGFVLESNNYSLYVFQASSLFIVLKEDETYSLINVEGIDLPTIIENFISLTDELVENKQPETTKIIKFCPNCGEPVIKGAKFCVNCGNKLN